MGQGDWSKGPQYLCDGTEGSRMWRGGWASGEPGRVGTVWRHSSMNSSCKVVKYMGSGVSLPGFKSWFPSYQLSDLREVTLPL